MNFPFRKPIEDNNMMKHSQLIAGFIAGAAFAMFASVMILPAISSDVQPNISAEEMQGMPKRPKHMEKDIWQTWLKDDGGCGNVFSIPIGTKFQSEVFRARCPNQYQQLKIRDAKEHILYEEMARAELIYEEQMRVWRCNNSPMPGFPDECGSSNPVAFGASDFLGGLAIGAYIYVFNNRDEIGAAVGDWVYEKKAEYDQYRESQRQLPPHKREFQLIPLD